MHLRALASSNNSLCVTHRWPAGPEAAFRWVPDLTCPAYCLLPLPPLGADCADFCAAILNKAISSLSPEIKLTGGVGVFQQAL